MARLAPARALAGWLLASAIVVTAPLAAQPWRTFLTSTPIAEGAHGYVEVPHHPALNPADGFTFEAWLLLIADAAGPACRSIAGKNWTQAWWVGICSEGGSWTLRSYLKGSVSLRDAGTVPTGWWAHVAVTFDGSKRRHYVNGELVGEFAETGPLPASPDPLRIFSDASWQVTPRGFVRQARLWRVARTLTQLRSVINRDLTAPQSGLVGVWPLAGGAAAVVGAHDGALGGSGAFASYFPDICFAGPQFLCLADRFSVRVRWQHPGGTGAGSVVPGFSSDSGLFWFFAPANWELLVKTVDGCDLNDRHWIFYAPVTDVHYDLEVFDRIAAKIRVFFGYQGATQGATDTDAFDTCP